MTAYIQFFEYNSIGELDEALASDGYTKVDGRLSVGTILSTPSLLANPRDYTLFEIRRGDFTNYRVVYSNLVPPYITYKHIASTWTQVCYYYPDFKKWAKDTYGLTSKQLAILKKKDK